MLSDENRKLVERFTHAGFDPDCALSTAELNHLLDAARSEPPADLKAVREVLEPFARARVLSIGFTPDSLHSAGEFIDGPTEQDFRRAAEVYASLNLSETVDGK